MVQRITQQMLSRSTLGNIQARQADLFAVQRQISSGLRYERASQDTRAASQQMDIKQALAFQDRLGTNATIAQDFNNTTENELKSASDIMARVRELALRSATETLNEQQLNGVSGELEGLLDSLTDIANATHEGNFVFGGFQNTRPPYELKKDVVLGGTGLSELGLAAGTHATRVETRSLSTAQAGAFVLNGGDLLINGVDIGSLTVNDPSRTAVVNAQTLVDLINAKSDATGVTARAVAMPDGSYANPAGSGGPLTGIALINLDEEGLTAANGIKVQGRGLPSATANLPLLRSEEIPLGDTRFTSERISGAPAAPPANVPAGTMSINGLAINSPMTFAAANTPEQNAQEIARAINTISAGTNVFAETDGYGFIKLRGIEPFTVAGAPAGIEIPNGDYEQARDTAASTGPVLTGSALRLGTGSLIVNGVDIFATPLSLDASLTAAQRGAAVAGRINARAGDSGVQASADSTGRIRFSNTDRHITSVSYRGDAGDNQAQIGSDSLVPLYMSGDQAFSGHRQDLTLVSSFDLPAAGLGSAVSTANVSFNAGDSLVAGQFQLNGTDILAGPMSGVAATDAGTLVSAINALSATTNVSAALDGVGGIRLSSDDGNPFTLVTAGTGALANVPAGSYLNALDAGDFIINGVDLGPIGPVPADPSNPNQNRLALGTALANAINAQSAISGVSAEARQDPTGGVRLLLTANGQDIEIDSNDALPNTLLAATGLAPGSRVDQRIDLFDAVMHLRDLVINSKFSRNTAETISIQSVKEITDAITQLEDNRVELGVRVQRAELVSNRSAYTAELLAGSLSENREIDMTEAITRMTQEETALEAAYAVTQRIGSLSLLNFI